MRFLTDHTRFKYPKRSSAVQFSCSFVFTLLFVFTQSLNHSIAQSLNDKIREFTIRENDTASYTLKLALDNDGRPVYFFRNVFTPVCLTGECKPVYINFYWDLVGNYTRYDLPPNQILTKMDHKEFKPEDYEKLRDILANPSSLLKDVAMDDLVGKGTENLADSVDAKAGATLKTVKNEVIDGAVYTCYTLWHLAHGHVVNEIRRITETYQDEQLLHRFLASTNHHYQYWAMDRVIDAPGTIWDGFTPDILTIIQGKNVFTARYALQRIANPFFLSDARQKWLWETYQKAGYALQIAILKRLKTVPFQPVLTEAMAQELPKANQEQVRMLVKLLAAQPNLSDTTQQLLARQLTHSNQEYTTAIYQLLKGLHSKNQEVLAQLKTFETTATQTNK